MTYDMAISKISPRIFHVRAQTQYLLAMAFMRMQESYDSAVVKRPKQYFSVERCMDAYAAKDGGFEYPEQWSGFNLPGVDVKSFWRKFPQRTLTEKERALMRLIRSKVSLADTKFCIIGTYRNGDLRHELSHAYYYLYQEYKQETEKLIEGIKRKAIILRALKEMGYCDAVLNDEIQAYLATSSDEWLTEVFGARDWSITKPFRQAFAKADSRYRKGKHNGRNRKYA